MARGGGQAKDDASFALPPFLPTISIGIQAPKAKGYALRLKDWPADPKIANKLNQHLSILKTTVMKKLIFPAVAALALGLASCSSDEVNPGNGGGTVNYAEGGYVRLSINMPSTKGTRATEATDDHANDQFNDGLASEYAVKDATLVLFEGTESGTEAEATFHSAYDLTSSVSMENSADNQITSMTKIVKKTDNKDHKKKLYALVVLNRNGVTEVVNTSAGTTPVVENGLKVNAGGTVTPITTSTTFKDFCDLLSKTPATPATGKLLAAPQFASDVSANGIFMTNAPLSEKQGTSADPTGANVTTLVNVTNSVYKTEKEAQNAPAADIFVERGVAKVTFSKEGSKGQGQGNLTGVEFTKAGNKMSYEIEGWNLDVTNKSSFLVRHTTNEQFGMNSSFAAAAAGDKFRFVGASPIAAQIGNDGTTPTTSTKNYYRTYWGVDPNYDKNTDTYPTEQFNKLVKTPNLSGDFGNSNPQYCYENTFDVAHQNQDQTTRVVVAVKLKHDGATTYSDLYAFNGDRSKLYSLADAKSRIKDAIMHALEGNAAHADLVKSDIEDDDIVLDTRNSATGVVAIKSFKAKDNGATTKTEFTTGAVFDAVKAEVGEITMYEKGIAYYPIRIKHFGDQSTPWNVTGQGVTAGNIYPAGPDRNNWFLGRYGVLRNNWYDISVGDIKGVGTPTIPSTDNIPDDELYNYISVRINILSWAKRTQHEDL